MPELKAILESGGREGMVWKCVVSLRNESETLTKRTCECPAILMKLKRRHRRIADSLLISVEVFFNNPYLRNIKRDDDLTPEKSVKEHMEDLKDQFEKGAAAKDARN